MMIDFGVAKNFLLVTSTHYVCLDSCLGSYLSLKAIENIVRRPNRMICLQTWADGDFLRFLLISSDFA